MSGRGRGRGRGEGRGRDAGRGRGGGGRGRGRGDNQNRGGGRGGRGRGRGGDKSKHQPHLVEEPMIDDNHNIAENTATTSPMDTGAASPPDTSTTITSKDPKPKDGNNSKKSNKKNKKKKQESAGGGTKKDPNLNNDNNQGQQNEKQNDEKGPRKNEAKKKNKSKQKKQDSVVEDSANSKNDDQSAASNRNQDKKNNKKKSENSNKSKFNNKTSDNNANTKPSIPPNEPQTTNDINYKRGNSITVLHIAEKPSIAQAIAKGLSKGTSFNNNSHSKLPIYELTTTASTQPFPKAPYASKCLHKVTSVAGHVFSVDFPSSYQSWDSVDPAELFNAPIQKKPCQGSVVKHLQSCSKNVDFMVLWLDCDREGENIAFEVLDCCMHLMNSSSDENYDRVYRAYFSAINPSDIQKAYLKLGKPDKNQSLSVDARQELDLKVGVAFSRFQTRFFQGRYGDLDSAVLSYGPCQTPTLGFCVKRHIDIETFKPEPYWLLNLGIVKRGRIIRAQWDSGRSFNQNKVQQLIQTCLEESTSTAKVTSIVSKDKKQGRPTPLNTVALLKACSKALGIGPHQAMQTAEHLYLSGYLSYPRTESTAYPKSFDVRDVLSQQAQDSRWGKYVADLLDKGHTKSRGGVDMGDHPPITPVRPAGTHELSGNMARVYELVTRHFIASVSPDACFKSTRVSINIESLKEKGNFTLRGKQLVSPGFLAILLHQEYGDEGDDDYEGSLIEDDTEEIQNLPEFTVGEEFYLTSGKKSSSKVDVVVTGSRATLDIKEKLTTPPSYLTESELISQMEKNGIGTDASIATHIENIQKRNYVELITGRKMKPSKLGLVLAQGYHQIDASLVLPKVRSDIESQCNKVAKGIANKDAVLKAAISLFEDKFKNFVENISKMDLLFSSSFSKLEDIGKPFTRCGLTRRYLQYITGPPARLYNTTTETVYPLPLGGVIKEWSGQKCPVEGCDFELCMYSVGQPQRTFPLCPNCFNNPKAEWGKIPGEENDLSSNPEDREDELKERQIRTVAGRAFTLECPHPDGHPLIKKYKIARDPESDGVFCMDAHFGPKWRLISTRSPTIIHLPKAISKITVLDRLDEDTSCHMLKIEYKADSTPLEGGETTYVTCFEKDEKLKEKSQTVHGNERTQHKGGRGGRGGRGKRGGRGRGGRGGRGRRG